MLEGDRNQRLIFGAGGVLLGLGLLFNPWLTRGVFESYGNASGTLTVPAIIVTEFILVGLSARLLYVAWRGAIGDLKDLLRRERLWLILAMAALVIVLWVLTHQATYTFYYMFGAYRFGIFALNLLVTVCAAIAISLLMNLEKWKQQLGNVGLIFGSLLFGLLMLEAPAAVGIIDYRTVFIPKGLGFDGPHNKRYSPNGFYHRPPMDEFIETRPGDAAVVFGVRTGNLYTSIHQYDELGFRNSPSDASPEIMLLGDSFIEGYKVSQGDTTTHHLDKFLSERVVNFAQSDFTPFHELSVLEEYVGEVQPKTVVWFLFEGNDVPPSGQSLDEVSFSTHLQSWREMVPRQRGFSRRSFSQNFKFFSTVWSTLIARSWSGPGAQVSQFGAYPGEESSPETAVYFEYVPAAPDAVAETALERLFVRGKSVADVHGSELLLVYIPIKFDVYKDALEFSEESAVRAWRSSGLNRLISEMCERNGIEFLDLTPALKAAAEEHVHVYLPDDSHWSPAGHELAAQEVERRLRRLGWVNGGEQAE